MAHSTIYTRFRTILDTSTCVKTLNSQRAARKNSTKSMADHTVPSSHTGILDFTTSLFIAEELLQSLIGSSPVGFPNIGNSRDAWTPTGVTKRFES